MKSKITCLFTVGLLLAVAIMTGCGGGGTETTPTSTETGTQSKPTPTKATVQLQDPAKWKTDVAPDLNPSIWIKVSSTGVQWTRDKKIQIKVINGEYELTDGKKITRSSITYQPEEMFTYPVGLMIEVSTGGVTLMGTLYEEGTILFVHEEGVLTVEG